MNYKYGNVITSSVGKKYEAGIIVGYFHAVGVAVRRTGLMTEGNVLWQPGT